jgi:hypothetical protein
VPFEVGWQPYEDMRRIRLDLEVKIDAGTRSALGTCEASISDDSPVKRLTSFN